MQAYWHLTNKAKTRPTIFGQQATNIGVRVSITVEQRRRASLVLHPH
jgi:hypothetical protein